MPVNTKHAEYLHYAEAWRKCEIFKEGSDAVKEAGTEFLPRLSGQNSQEYDAYRMRAMMFNPTERTIQGLVGAVFGREPTLHINEKEDREYFDSLPKERCSFIDFAKAITTEVINKSRVGILVDVDKEGGDPYVLSYNCLSIINWKTPVINGELTATLIVLEDPEPVQGNDEFEVVMKERYRVLRLVEVDGTYEYQQELWTKLEGKTSGNGDHFVKSETIIPTRNGRPLERIPFIVINASHLGFKVEKPMMLDLVNLNWSHYLSSADLEHGRHFTGLPTAWIAGFPAKTRLQIGSTTAWVSNNPKATAGYLEFTGQGLAALEKALEQKEKLIAILGARFLEPQTDSVESSETHKIRRQGENSILAGIANTISSGLSQIVQIAYEWQTGTKVNVRVALNNEYTTVTADPQMLTALLAAMQQGRMSFTTWFFNLKKLQLVPPERTMEDEMNEIEMMVGELSGTTTDMDNDQPDNNKPDNNAI